MKLIYERNISFLENFFTKGRLNEVQDGVAHFLVQVKSLDEYTGERYRDSRGKENSAMSG
ncbi:MAG: hypothetical protein Q7T80_01410 [Methanoregula sp.]|nr:hypothetical protein [Methanoregula sp.]